MREVGRVKDEKSGGHWSAAYIGRPYAEHNCGQFAGLVQREVFDREVRLPDAQPRGARHQTRMILDLLDDYADRTETPVDGDLVVMVCGSRLRHAGLFCAFGRGRGYVLHAMRRAGQVVLHRLRDLPREGLHVEGYYRWR